MIGAEDFDEAIYEEGRERNKEIVSTLDIESHYWDNDNNSLWWDGWNNPTLTYKEFIERKEAEEKANREAESKDDYPAYPKLANENKEEIENNLKHELLRDLEKSNQALLSQNIKLKEINNIEVAKLLNKKSEAEVKRLEERLKKYKKENLRLAIAISGNK